MLAVMSEPQDDRHRLLTLAVHELRTPLNVAAGYLKMLVDRRSGPLTDQQLQLAGRAGDSLDALTRLISDLAEIARLESGTLTLASRRHDLLAVAAEAVAAFVPPQESHVQAVLQGGPGPYPIAADAERLVRSLRGCLAALAREVPLDATIVASVAGEGSPTATVTLAPADLLPVLDPDAGAWGPADEWRGGTGLELPLARRVIELHGGRLLSPPGPERRPALMLCLPLAAGA